LVSKGDELSVRLVEKTSGNLFAECPIPNDKPLVASVEKVVDSSRYYVLRVEDRGSGRHAFLGFGFRERHDATAFAAALDDHRQQMRRAKEARELATRFNVQGPQKDYSLKAGDKVHINIAGLRGGGGAAVASGQQQQRQQQQQQQQQQRQQQVEGDTTSLDSFGNFTSSPAFGTAHPNTKQWQSAASGGTSTQKNNDWDAFDF